MTMGERLGPDGLRERRHSLGNGFPFDSALAERCAQGRLSASVGMTGGGFGSKLPKQRKRGTVPMPFGPGWRPLRGLATGGVRGWGGVGRVSGSRIVR